MCKRIVICGCIHACEGASGLAVDNRSNGSSEIVVVVIHALMHTSESR